MQLTLLTIFVVFLTTSFAERGVGKCTEVIVRRVKPGFEEQHFQATENAIELARSMDAVVVRVIYHFNHVFFKFIEGCL